MHEIVAEHGAQHFLGEFEAIAACVGAARAAVPVENRLDLFVRPFVEQRHAHLRYEVSEPLPAAARKPLAGRPLCNQPVEEQRGVALFREQLPAQGLELSEAALLEAVHCVLPLRHVHPQPLPT